MLASGREINEAIYITIVLRESSPFNQLSAYNSHTYVDLMIFVSCGFPYNTCSKNIILILSYIFIFQQLKFALKIFNYFFTSVFILEAAMKIVALSFMRYLKDRSV